MEQLLFINTDMCPGGIEVSLLNLLKRINYTKYAVRLALLSDNLSFVSEIPEQVKVQICSRSQAFYRTTLGGKIYKIIQRLLKKNQRLFYEKVVLHFLRPLEEWLYVLAVEKELKKCDMEKVIAYRHGITMKIAERLAHHPDLFFYHVSGVEFNRDIEKQMKSSKKVITVSDEQRRAVMMAFSNIPPAKIHILPNIVDIEGIREKSKQKLDCAYFPCTEGKIIIGTCGRLVKDKGFDFLLKAMSILKKHGREVVLLIVGGADGTRYDRHLKRLTIELELIEGEDVVFAGWQTNPYPLMRMMDIYIQPSRVESYGITIREAQILGLPVISTRTHGGVTLVKNNETGIICDFTIEALVTSMERLIACLKERKRLAENCQHTDFDIENQHTLEIFYKLLNTN